MHLFQTFWWGESLTPYETACLGTFLACGHEVDLYAFSAPAGVPAGVTVKDASEILSQDRFFTYESGTGKGSPAAFANLFRYKLLLEKGGWWIDTDVVCLSAQVPTFESFFAWQQNDLVNSAVMHFAAGHPVIQRCLARAEQLGRTVKWGDTGPTLITGVLNDLKLIGQASPASTCYPVHYSQALDLLRPSEGAAILDRCKSGLFLHLWNEILRRNAINKHCLPPRGSALRSLFDAIPVSGWTGEYNIDVLEHHLSLAASLERLTAALEVDAARVEQLGAEIASLRENLADAMVQLSSREREHADVHASLQEKLLAVIEERDRLVRGIEDLVTSNSWRATAPLRAVANRVRSLVGVRNSG